MSKRIKHLTMAVLTSAVLTAQAACPTWATADRFTLNGAEVTDKRTGLIWKRCSEGQNWSGSNCTGNATTHTHEAALALAKTANSSQSATGWRLPNVKELASLADKGCQSPAIDSAAFPATPNSAFWASTPYLFNSSQAWFVIFYNGMVSSHVSRFTTFTGYSHVRLVRSSQ